MVDALAVIGGLTVSAIALLVLLRLVAWLRFCYRRSPVKWYVISLKRAHDLEQNSGWDIKVGGLFVKHFGIGFVWGSAPTYRCEEGCSKRFRTEQEAIDHELEAHGAHDE